MINLTSILFLYKTLNFIILQSNQIQIKMKKILLISTIFLMLISFNSCTKDEDRITVLCLVCEGSDINPSEFNSFCEGVNAESLIEEGVQVKLTKQLLEQYKTLFELSGASCSIK